MRVFISADIEGVAGVAHLPTTGPGRFDFDHGRAWMTGEVIAAAEGARAAGAEEVVVADGHGSAHNLLLDELPDYVRVVRSWPRPLLQMQGIEDGAYEAMVLIGHHAHAAAERGVLAHTFSNSFRDIRVDGVSQSETTLNAMVAAEFGVPTVFTSGDDIYVAHTEAAIPGIRTVVTKTCCGFSAINSLTPAVARQKIRQAVEEAVAARARIAPIEQPDRYELEIDFTDRHQVEMLGWLPWVRRTGRATIVASLPDAVQTMRVISFLCHYVTSGIARHGEFNK